MSALRHDQVFLDALTALNHLRVAYQGVCDGVQEGRLTSKVGSVTAELQWPWHGFDSKLDKSRPFAMRFYVEAKVDGEGEEP